MNHSIHEQLKLAVATFFIAAAWLFPYFSLGYRDTQQQLLALGLLSGASLLCGMKSVRRSAIAPLLFLIFLIAVVSDQSIQGKITGISGLLLAIVAMHLGAKLRQKPYLLPWFLFAIVAAAFVNAFEGLLQWFGLVGELYRWVAEPERRGVAFGAFRQTNLFATFLCIGSVCTVWLVHRRKLSESMAWFILSGLIFGVAASGSRTGSLELLVLAVLAWSGRKQQAPAVTRLLVGQVGVLAAAMTLLTISARWLEFEFSSGAERVSQVGLDGRFRIWSNALQLIAARPWAGWGWSETAYGHYITLFDYRYDGMLGNVHNLPLQMAVEFGLPATALLIIVVIQAVCSARPWRLGSVDFNKLGQNATGSAQDQRFAWFILIFIVGVHSMLEYPLWHGGFLYLAGLFLGYLYPVGTEGRVISNYMRWSTHAAKFVAVSLLVLALAAWQQYARLLPIYKTPFTNDRAVQRTAVAAALSTADDAWLFREQLDFAKLGLLDVTVKNAFEVRQLAEKLLHFSAEPRVIQPLLLSLWYLDDQTALNFHVERFCHAFPVAFERWSQDPANHALNTAVIAPQTGCRPMIQ